MYCPKITKDTPLEEIKRIHRQIWKYVVKIGRKPYTPYCFHCVDCEYVRVTENSLLNCYNKCPIAWFSTTEDGLPCGTEFYQWLDCQTKETAEKIRDIPFKYELEKKGEENSQNLS